MIQTRTLLHCIRMNLGVEPVLLLYSGLQSIVAHGLLKDVITAKLCGDTNCTSEQVTQLNSFHLYHRLLETIPSILPCLILGGWSDYHGRLPLVMTALCGDLLKNIVILAQAISTWKVSFILLASSLSGITGNWPLIMLACVARGCDISDPRIRTLKLGCIVGLWWLGQGIGFLTIAYRKTGTDYDTYHLVTVIAISVVSCIEVLLIVYTNICVQETVPDFGDYNGSGWRTIIMPIHINSAVNSIFRGRVNNGRTCLLMLLGIIIMDDIITYGEQSVYCQYLSLKLDISGLSYCLVYGGGIILASITVMVCLLITKRCEIEDTSLGIAGSVSTMTTSLLLAAITTRIIWPAYLVLLPFVFKLLVPTITLSLLSKVVHTSEIGAMLATVATMDSVVPLLAEVSYMELYKSTHSSLSEGVYLISIVLSVVSALLFLFMKRTLNPCFGFFEASERVPLINHSESYQGTVL